MSNDQSSASQHRQISDLDYIRVEAEPVYAGDAADYIAKMATELIRLAHDAHLSFLAHLLSMAHEEAASIARDQKLNTSKI